MSIAESSWPVCKQCCDIGLRAVFCFAKRKEVGTKKPGTNVGYSITFYKAQVGQIRAAIVHGEGPTWTLGLPNDCDVWDSVESAQTGPSCFP